MQLSLVHRNIRIEYVADEQSLLDAIKEINQCKEIGFDLEFDRDRFQYGFNLCLIQVALPKKCFVIDPLKGFDLKPLFAVFENPDICKVASACDQDLRLLHTLNCKPKNVFDTDIAAKLLDYEFSSILKLVAAKFDVEMNKQLQTSNWGLRPLSIAQITYSVEDVIFLIRLKHILEQEAKDRGVHEWLEDEWYCLDQIAYEVADENNLLGKDEKKLSPYHQFVINELLKYREKIAQKFKRPPNHIFPKALILSIAFEEIDPRNWTSQVGIYPSLKNESFAESITQLYHGAVAKANEQKLNRKTDYQMMTDEDRKRASIAKFENERIKQEVFQPIQQLIADRYGKFTSRYILSNAKVTDILQTDARIGDFKANYKKQLILRCADELGIDVNPFF